MQSRKHYPANAWTSVWGNMGSAASNPMHVEWFGMVVGLGFVLAFGYWCTDFLVVQRAMAAESMSAARRTPVIATIPKILIPAIVIVPGMIALVAKPHEAVFARPACRRKSAEIVTSKLPPPCIGLIPPKVERCTKVVNGNENDGISLRGRRKGQCRSRLQHGHPHDARAVFPHRACWGWG